MSGAFGWGGKDRRDQNQPADNTGFSRAVDAYSRPAPRTPSPAPTGGGGQSYMAPGYQSQVVPPVPAMDLTPTRDFKSTAANVIIVATDVTGSLSDWRQDIFKFLPLLFQEAQQYMGDDLEIMFIAYGDAKFSDRIEVATFGRGQVLDTHLTALYKNANGGGNAAESSELVAYFIHERVDTKSAKNVYTFFITDEPCQHTVSDTEVRTNLNLTLNPELRDSRTLFTSLLRRMEVFVVFAETGSYDQGRVRTPEFENDWRDIVGQERVCPMPRSNLVIETMLAVVAKTTGQLAVYTQNYASRRAGTQFGMVNKSHVDRSIALVPGAGPAVPNIAPKSRLLTDSD
jgi:hypothetical protein